jgi:hypothetical protein
MYNAAVNMEFKKVAIVVGFILVLLVLAFGWPTLYRYDTVQTEGYYKSFVVRTNRITGKSERNLGAGWFPQPVSTSPAQQ